MDFAASAPDGAAVLDRAVRVILKFCALPSKEAADAIALWAACTHALPALPSAPRLVVTSAVKRSGKTRVLDVVEGISYDPLAVMNASTAAVFRSLDREHPPTLIFDEVDTIFGSARVAENNEDLRGLLNAGFQRGKTALRCVGPHQVPTPFPTFAMAAMAGIGGVPDTIRDRAVNVRMRRRKPGEQVSPFRERRDRPALVAIREQVTVWLGQPDARKVLENAVPQMDLEDREADVWEPLVMVADLAGAEWPQRARNAAKRLTSDSDSDEDDSPAVHLLHDLHGIYGDVIKADWCPTEILLGHLHGLEERPWGDLTAHRMGAMLREFSIKSCRDTAGQKRGYRRADFADAWERYPVTESDGES